MATAKKQRFTVSLNVDDYTALKRLADSQKPPLSLQYVVSYAITEFISAHKNKQIELDFVRKSK